MKTTAVLFLAFSLLPAFSKTPTANSETEVRPKSYFGTPLVTDKEKAEVSKAVESMLSRHVTFRQDGTASSVHTTSTRRQVEWKNLKIAEIHYRPITEADKLNGVTKHFLVSLRCDAHRVWDDKKSAWGAWLPIGYLLFPQALALEWKGSAWTCLQADRLKAFAPGPGAPARRSAPPAPGDPGLPPGMRRAR
ncbi:MAG: hypothetical protein K9N23_02945 [Akkermansiaceae bacterium]|nr:hypothetical protein [Akkermansiaceae bacterium]MCF7730611.1 hypothetical protein [Akkermansiaceae bacterium]